MTPPQITPRRRVRGGEGKSKYLPCHKQNSLEWRGEGFGIVETVHFREPIEDLAGVAGYYDWVPDNPPHFTEKQGWMIPETHTRRHESHHRLPHQRPSLESRFKRLAKQWHDDTDFLSSPTQRKNDRAYRKILSMGKVAIPYILRELRDNGGDWYEALTDMIEGPSPVRPEDQGNIDKMKTAWIQWGRDHGYAV